MNTQKPFWETPSYKAMQESHRQIMKQQKRDLEKMRNPKKA